MEQQTTSPGRPGAYEGKDFVCRTCGCEIMVKHWGDPDSHVQEGVFLCHCGTTLEPEHGSGSQGGQASGGDAEPHFSQDDFLNEGSGAGGAGGMGSTSSTSASPGGGM